MSGDDIIKKFEALVGDSLDSTFSFQLLNDSKNSIETELQLEITKKLDSSGSVSAGQTYVTARDLPEDFFLPLRIYIGTRPVYPAPFERQQEYQSDSSRYWIDVGSNNYHLGGTQGTAATIYFYYQYATPDINSESEPVWPARFHSIIPYEMARKYFAIDQSEKSRSWLPEHQLFYDELKRQMIHWDQQLKLHAIGDATPYGADSGSTENQINLN